MNSTVIIYASTHHGNTEKLVKAIAAEYPADTLNIVTEGNADLSVYERIGIASGVAFGKYYPELLAYLNENLPEGKKVFFIHTAGKPEEKQCAAAKEMADSRHCGCLGVFCCKGYDTYGPFKLIGGLNRSHPDAEDIAAAKQFYAGL